MAVTADGSIMGVGRIHRQEDHSMRIRYMAVSKSYRHLGVGSLILQRLLSFASENTCSKYWLYARSEAVVFYQKNGFSIIGPAHISLTIPHYQMEALPTRHINLDSCLDN